MEGEGPRIASQGCERHSGDRPRQEALALKTLSLLPAEACGQVGAPAAPASAWACQILHCTWRTSGKWQVASLDSGRPFGGGQLTSLNEYWGVLARNHDSLPRRRNVHSLGVRGAGRLGRRWPRTDTAQHHPLRAVSFLPAKRAERARAPSSGAASQPEGSRPPPSPQQE